VAAAAAAVVCLVVSHVVVLDMVQLEQVPVVVVDFFSMIV
jgi:hypothetical protein